MGGANMEAFETQKIPVAEIRPCPLLGETTILEKQVAALAERLKKRGLQQPLLVRPSAEKGSPKYELISGAGWLAAAKQLGWPTIAGRIETLSDQQALLAGLREGTATGELSAVARARGYRRLHEAPFKLSYQQMASELGLKDAVSVRRVAGLLNQPPEILDLLSQRLLHEGHLRYLNRLTNAGKRVALAKRAVKGGWSVAQVRKHVGRPRRRTAASGSRDKGYDYNGFHLVREGDRILFSGRDFQFSRDSPAQFARELQSALESFIRNHMAEETAAALREIQRALESSPVPDLPPAPTAPGLGKN
jgi:ParB family transcriptional regulator, chromosome partitioning protein